MMQKASALPFVIFAMAFFVVAAKAEGAPFSKVGTIPCRAFLAFPGSAFYGDVIDAVSSRLDELHEGENFGSTCNIGDYMIKACRTHPAYNLASALNWLVRLRRSGHSLPRIPMCGA